MITPLSISILFELLAGIVVCFLIWRYITPPQWYCLKQHRTWHEIQTTHNIKTPSSFFFAILCKRCERIRHIEHFKCNECGYYFKPDVIVEHRKGCRLVIASDPSVITAAMYNRIQDGEPEPASEADFEWFYDIARTHNLSAVDCERIAQVELGKSLSKFTRREIIDFGRRICELAHCPTTRYERGE